MATHSSTLAWKIPWTEEPGRLQSMWLQKVKHERLHFTHFILYHWRRKRQPTPVFLPGESHGQGSLVGHGPLGRRELDTTKVTEQEQIQNLILILYFTFCIIYCKFLIYI